MNPEPGSFAGGKFDTIESAITAFSQGKFVILLDSPSRENEADLAIPSVDLSEAQCAFLIRHSSGFVCVPMEGAVAARLALPLMVPSAANADPHQTAYCVSVDAADAPPAQEEGEEELVVAVSTGISARDRARTCRLLGDPAATPHAFRRPGHVLPLRARDGGLAERRGHTEAAVELCRLAGKPPVAVICELVVDGHPAGDGRSPERIGAGMMRRDDAIAFGKKWSIPVCTIDALSDFMLRQNLLPTVAAPPCHPPINYEID